MSIFQFKHFSIQQAESAMKVGTDAMILGAFIKSQYCEKALDVGAGTGVLSLMVAQSNDDLIIDAIEIDGAAAEECDHNFKASNWSDRLNLIHKDFLSFTSNQSYDLIFSNPPFYQSTLINTDERKGRARHEKSLPIAPFLENVNHLLAENGVFWLIIPYDDLSSWQECARLNRLHVNARVTVFGKRNDLPKRVILKLGRTLIEPKETSLVIRESDGSYSQEYLELTKEFHGKAI